jgi:hypothetical protein
MSISSETLKQDLDQLTQDQLQQVADFIAFLKFREQQHPIALDASQIAVLATEFAEDDRTLAEAGIGDYAAMLHQEDHL